MPLHLDYRPKTLDELYGNDGVKASIRTILDRPDRPRSWLFTGPSGCGKTTLARILANAWGCGEQDYHELNIADARGIDDARQLMAQMHYGPISPGGKIKIYCLDEIQDSTANFQSALLKALEDTPKHIVFVLCTTDPQKLKPAIKTRCSTYQVHPLPGPIMRKMIRDILEKEGTALPDEAMAELVSAAEGSPRQAIVILDQVIDIADEGELIETIRRNRPLESTVKDLAMALLERKTWPVVSKILQGYDENTNWEQLRIAVFRYCGGVLLRSGNPHAFAVMEAFKDPMFNSGKNGMVFACFNSLIRKG